MTFALGLLLLVAAPPTETVQVTVVRELPEGFGFGGDRVDEVIHRVTGEWVGAEFLSIASLYANRSEMPAAKCGADVECLGRELTYVGVEYVLVMVVSDASRLLLRLIDTKAKRIVARDARAWDGATVAPLEDGLRSVLGSMALSRFGALHVRAEPADATIFVADGTGLVVARGAGPHRLAPGAYEVRAERDGHVEGARAVELGAGASAQVELSLRKMASPWYTSGWFWGVTGVVVAGAAIGVAVAASRPDRCICIGMSADQCPPC